MNYLREWLRGKRNLLVLSGLLLVFIVGLYSINFIVEQDFETRLVILPQKHNGGTLVASPNTSFHIESATKQSNSYPMYDFFVADSNTVLLNRMQSSYTGIKLSVLHMDDNEVKDISKNTGYGLAFTPDRKKAVFTQFGSSENDNHAYAYDWNSGELQQFGQDNAYFREFIDSNTYIGFDGVNFMEGSLAFDEQKNLFTLEELQARIAKLFEHVDGINVMAYPEIIVIDTNNQYMYMIIQIDENNMAMYRLSLQGDEEDAIFARMSAIHQYILLSNGDLLISGKLNNIFGLYLYERQHEQLTLLKRGDILDFDFDEQTSRLAYVQMLDNQVGKNELHAVYLQDKVFKSDTIIYRNIQDLIKVTWLGDDLFVGGSSLDSSGIYRFTFSVW